MVVQVKPESLRGTLNNLPSRHEAGSHHMFIPISIIVLAIIFALALIHYIPKW